MERLAPPESPSLLARLADPTAAPVVLDGGLGTHLEALGADVTGALWSAQILRDQPELVRRAHDDFLAAGAQVLTTCSYQVTRDGLEAAGLDPDEAPGLLRASVARAREAADAVSGADGAVDGAVPIEGSVSGSGGTAGGPWVLASVGPYGAGPGAGTEYDGEYGIGPEELGAWHRERLADLDAQVGPGGADAVIVETIPSLPEVRALAIESAHLRSPVLLSLTVADGRLRDGSDLRDVARILDRAAGVAAIGINCCTALDAVRALETIGQATAKPLFAYPNSGEAWNAEARSWHGRETEMGIVDVLPRLRAAGARMIGGCCRVGPSEISRIADALHAG